MKDSITITISQDPNNSNSYWVEMATESAEAPRVETVTEDELRQMFDHLPFLEEYVEDCIASY